MKKFKLRITNISTKYMIIFMAVVIVTVLLLGVIITTILNSFSQDRRMKDMYNTNLMFESFYDRVAEKEGTMLEILENNEENLDEVLDIIFLTSPYCDVVLFDADGNLIFFASAGGVTEENAKFRKIYINPNEDEDEETTQGTQTSSQLTKDPTLHERDEKEEKKPSLPTVIDASVLSKEILLKLKESLILSKNDDCDGFLSRNMVYYISTISDTNARAIGYAMTYDRGAEEGDLIFDMMFAIIITFLWISVGALFAIYGVSLRVMRPLREIGRAAKKFSKGDFNVRVPVRGEDELAQLAISFNKMAKDLQSKDEMQKNFLSNVSHDLRTPMTTIAGFIDGILDGAVPYEKQDYYLNIIKSEVQRLSRLVSSLLDISRMQSGERKFDMKPFNIAELARQTIISFEHQLEEKNLDVEFECEEFDMIAYGDSDAINQVIYNLCHNAIKFSYEKGKYKLEIKYVGKNQIEFSMYNEGIGIAKEDLPYVFDRFYKSDKSRGVDKSGVGLGLFITRTIIEAHGEKILVDSEYGKYCKFTFTIKRAQ